ncbi:MULTISPECIES: hypothetical protein [Pseudomonas]|uniref:Uncharacterized protein n=1 Tax=Pseudomonas reactans TaxID=117680 RepID=A0A7Y8G933_9PSED|nr:hypothetical protein [Pseudomonas reactans]NWE92819.1 hypothetical protein [Pseudomonas reactans]
MQPIKTTMFLALLGALTGCGAISYHTIERPDPEGLTKFELQSSALRLDTAQTDPAAAVGGKQKAATAIATGDIVLTSVPTASSSHRYAIEATDHWWWKTTHLGVTKRPDTDLIQQLTVDTEDNRVKLIESAGAIGVTVVGMLFTEGGIKNSIPDAQALESELAATKGRADNKIPLSFAGGTIKGFLAVEKVPNDAIETQTFIDNYFSKGSDVLIYSACRKGTVELMVAGELKTWSVVVADPSYVQTIKIPEKGKLSSHAGCGVDSSSDPSSVASGAEVVNKLVAQTKAIIDAKEKAGTN